MLKLYGNLHFYGPLRSIVIKYYLVIPIKTGGKIVILSILSKNQISVGSERKISRSISQLQCIISDF